MVFYWIETLVNKRGIMLNKYKTCNSYYGIWKINLYKEDNVREMQHSLIFIIDYNKGNYCSVNINSFDCSDSLYYDNSQKLENIFSHYRIEMQSQKTTLISDNIKVKKDVFTATLIGLSLGWGSVFSNLFYDENDFQLNIIHNKDKFDKLTKVPHKGIDLLISSDGYILEGMYRISDTIYKVEKVIEVVKL